MIYDELYDEIWHATADLSLVNSVVHHHCYCSYDGHVVGMLCRPDWLHLSHGSHRALGPNHLPC